MPRTIPSKNNFYEEEIWEKRDGKAPLRTHLSNMTGEQMAGKLFDEFGGGTEQQKAMFIALLTAVARPSPSGENKEVEHIHKAIK